jgi:hypothetical protein
MEGREFFGGRVESVDKCWRRWKKSPEGSRRGEKLDLSGLLLFLFFWLVRERGKEGMGEHAVAVLFPFDVSSRM